MSARRHVQAPMPCDRIKFSGLSPPEVYCTHMTKAVVISHHRGYCPHPVISHHQIYQSCPPVITRFSSP